MLRLLFLASAALAPAILGASPVSAAPRHHVVAEYGLPANQSLSALVTGPDQNVWVAGYEQISRVTPSGTVTTYSTAANGDSLAVGPDNALWFGSVNGTSDLGRITMAGKVTYTTIPAPPGAKFIPEILGIVTGPDGNLWMTDYSNAEIIRLTMAGAITYFPLGSGAFPYGITDGPDGALWIADDAGRLDRVTISGAVTTFGLPGFSGVHSVTLGGDGNLWVNNANGSLGRVTPQGHVTAFPVPQRRGSAADIQFVATDGHGRIWFTAWYAYPAENAGIMTMGGQAKLLKVPTKGSGAYAIAPGPGGKTMWFTEAFANKVAEAK